MKNYPVLLVLFLSIISGCSQKEKDYLNESEEEFSKRINWFNEAKYGMFIHFGLYSQLGGVYKGETSSGYAEWILANAQIPKEEYMKLRKSPLS